MRTLVRVLLGPTHEQAIQLKITKAVETIVPSRLKAVFSFQPGSFEDLTHTLATTIILKHPHSSEKGYLADDVPDVTFTGPIVWSALVRAHKVSVYAELTHLLSIFSAIPQARGFGGWLFEQYCMFILK